MKIRLTVDMEYLTPGEEARTAEEMENLRWHLEENNCKMNVLWRLTEMVEIDEEASVCNVCRFAEVKCLPDDAHVYSMSEVASQ